MHTIQYILRGYSTYILNTIIIKKNVYNIYYTKKTKYTVNTIIFKNKIKNQFNSIQIKSNQINFHCGWIVIL